MSNKDLMDFGMEFGEEEEFEEPASEKFTLSKTDAEVGIRFGGKPIIDLTEDVIVDDVPKKYSFAFLTIVNETNDQYLNIRMNFPKLDKDGWIRNLNKDFEFFREGFNFIISLQRLSNPDSVINPKTGEEITFIRKFNMKKALEYIGNKEWIDIEITEGIEDSDYNSFKIIRVDG